MGKCFVNVLWICCFVWVLGNILIGVEFFNIIRVGSVCKFICCVSWFVSVCLIL